MLAMAAEKTRIAVVGAGHVAQVAHIPAYRANPEAELVAIVDYDPVKAKRIKAQFGFRESYDDFNTMLRKSDVHAVDICTPNYLHAPMAIAALHGAPRTLTADMLSDRIASGAVGAVFDVALLCEAPLASAVTHLEVNLLKKTLVQTNWNKSRAARRLGLSRQGLLKKIKRYGIERALPGAGQDTGGEESA